MAQGRSFTPLISSTFVFGPPEISVADNKTGSGVGNDTRELFQFKVQMLVSDIDFGTPDGFKIGIAQGTDPLKLRRGNREHRLGCLQSTDYA